MTAPPDPMLPPLDADEGDPDAAEVAGRPGYSAGGAGDGDVPVSPPSQDPAPPA